MADCSRNAVLNVASAKQMIEESALMGHSTFRLYMEDTYQIERAAMLWLFPWAYSAEELQEIKPLTVWHDLCALHQTLALVSLCPWGVKSAKNSVM